MRKSLFTITLATTCLAVCVTVGVGIYNWLQDGDKVACAANEFTFGCSTTLGWILSGVGVVVFAGAVCLWERYRGN